MRRFYHRSYTAIELSDKGHTFRVYWGGSAPQIGWRDPLHRGTVVGYLIENQFSI